MTALVLRGDARALPLPDASVDLIVTSPPYWSLRDYRDGDASLSGQIGAESTPGEYIDNLLECTREWMRVLKPEGSLWLNLGDKYSQRPGQFGPQGKSGQRATRSQAATYADAPARRDPEYGVAPKSLLGLPWRYAIACIDHLGLILRAEVIWSKPSAMPESVTDRVRRAHEQWFHLVKQPQYFAAVDEVREPHVAPPKVRGVGGYDGANGQARHGFTSNQHPLGKLPGSVWEIASQPLTVPSELGVSHFAAFPMELPRRIIRGWSPSGICTECGEGRRPMVNSVKSTSRPGIRVARRDEATLAPKGGNALNEGRCGDYDRTITGSTCACPTPDALTRPAVVLDPFGGTGTTALVASVLGRRGVTVDRSADYCRIAQWRTTDPGERARALGLPKPPPVPDGLEALFDPAEVTQ